MNCLISDVNECLWDDSRCRHGCKWMFIHFSFSISDVNECLRDNGGCRHGCCNTIGSFYCKCPPGYTLALDKQSCHGKFYYIVFLVPRLETKRYFSQEKMCGHLSSAASTWAHADWDSYQLFLSKPLGVVTHVIATYHFEQNWKVL